MIGSDTLKAGSRPGMSKERPSGSPSLGVETPAHERHPQRDWPAYWKSEFDAGRLAVFTQASANWADWEPIFRLATDSFVQAQFTRPWDEAAPDLAIAWPRVQGSSTLKWNQVEEAAREVWQRLSYPSDVGPA